MVHCMSPRQRTINIDTKSQTENMAGESRPGWPDYGLVPTAVLVGPPEFDGPPPLLPSLPSSPLSLYLSSFSLAPVMAAVSHQS